MCFKSKRAVSKVILGVVVAVIIVVGAVVAYVSMPTPSAPTATSTSVSAPSTLVMDTPLWPFSDLNTLSPTGDSPQWAYFAVYQPLVAVNDSLVLATGISQYLPCLAVNWTVSADGTLYTFNLRRGVTFSNGDPFNAYQYWTQVYSVYYLSGNTSSFITGYDMMYQHMATADFGPATIALINQTGTINPSSAVLSIMMNSSWPIYVTGPYQIVFHLLAPFPYFLSTLYPSTIMLAYDMQWVLDHGGGGTPTSPNTYLNTHPIPGTGPYIITGLSEMSWESYTQNPNYWGENLTAAQIQANPLIDPGHVKNVIVYYKPDDLTRYTDLTTGEAQVVAIEAADWPAIQTNPAKYNWVRLAPTAQSSFAIALNTERYPTNITAFRQAIVHAINYTDFNQKVFLGTATQFVGPTFPAFEGSFYDLGNFPNYQYNVTLAEQYLSQANISNIPPLTFTVLSGCPPCTTAAEVIQADLAQLNITTNIEVQTPSGYFTPYGSYQYNLANAAQIGHISILGGNAWQPDALNPVDNWVTQTSKESAYGNFAVYNNPIVEACSQSFFNGTSIANLQAICAKAQARVYSDAPYVYFSLGLWYPDGSLVWLKSGPVKSFLLDPTLGGEDSVPIFNTVTFQSASEVSSSDLYRAQLQELGTIMWSKEVFKLTCVRKYF